MWEDVYIKPYCRASPWIVGLCLGYVFFKLQKSKIKVKISYVKFNIVKILSKF